MAVRSSWQLQTAIIFDISGGAILPSCPVGHLPMGQMTCPGRPLKNMVVDNKVVGFPKNLCFLFSQRNRLNMFLNRGVPFFFSGIATAKFIIELHVLMLKSLLNHWPFGGSPIVSSYQSHRP